MISLKFPPLEKLLEKNIGELEDDDPKKGICIIDGHAVIVMSQAMLFFDLADYFVKNNGLHDNNVINEMNSILEWMEGKMFSPMFWKELTSINQVSVSDDGIELDGIIRKDLYYQSKHFDQTEIKMLCHSIAQADLHLKAINAMYLEPLLTIFTGLKTMIKKDTIIFRTVGENTQIHFTFESNPWISGVTANDASISSKAFLFDALDSFSQNIVK